MNVAEMQRQVMEWAERDPNIRALIVTGSRGRGVDVDEFSDLDIELVARDLEPLARDHFWVRRFGEVMVRLDLYTADGYPTRLVFYSGGTKIDFTLCDEGRVERMKSEGLDALYDRGLRVLVDKDELTAGLPSPAFRPTPLPTQEQFEACVNEFWFEAAHIPRYLARNELWVVKFRDWTMKSCLLRVLEWRALAAGRSPPPIGSRLEGWVDEETQRRLPEIFAGFDAASSWRSYLSMMDLFREEAVRVAADLGLAYPRETDRKVTEYVASFEPPPP